jgi:hypothetical protein
VVSQPIRASRTAREIGRSSGIGPSDEYEIEEELERRYALLALSVQLTHTSANANRWGQLAVDRSLQKLLVGKNGQLLRHDHAPGVEDELTQLVLVDSVETDDEPLEAHFGRLRA